MPQTIEITGVSLRIGRCCGAAVLAFAALAAGCQEGPAALDPWQETPLEEAAIACDQDALREHLETMRRFRLEPNLRDLHAPDGTVALLARGCEAGLLNPALMAGDVEILRTLLELGGFEATADSVRESMLFASLDRTRMALPETRTRSGVWHRAAIVSINESGVIRVSSGESLTVSIPGLADLLSFASSVMSRSTDAPGRPDDFLSGTSEVALDVDPRATYEETIAALDELAASGTTLPIAVPSASGPELVLGIGAGPGDPPAFAIRADRGLPVSTVAGVLHTLARAGVERLVLLSELDLQQPSGPEPGTDPGGLPGGLELTVRGLRDEPPSGFWSERGADVPRFIEPPPAETVTLPDADTVFELPSAPSSDGPLNVGGDVSPPVKVHAPPPQYTEIARKARIQGVVILQAIIDSRGDVTSVKVLKGLPMGLDAQAIEAVRRWTFEPATLDGEPVAVYYNLTVNFRLD